MISFDAQQQKSAGRGTAAGAATLDAAEVDRFSRIAAEWWDPDGKFRPLHQLGPARLSCIRDRLLAHFAADRGADDTARGGGSGTVPLAGLTVLDVGCGGGLISEPLCRMGARVTGIDPSTETIEAARAHSAPQGLSIEYRAARAEDLVAAGETFDAVVCLEVLEHVPDPAAFVAMIARLVRPGGVLVLSTINRTLKSYALAIVAAEYVLGWLPRGTHQWDRFITTDELQRHVAAAGLGAAQFDGLGYDPMRDRWTRIADTDVNYMAVAAKPANPA